MFYLMLAHRDKVRFVRPLPKCKSKRFVSQVVLCTLPESQSYSPFTVPLPKTRICCINWQYIIENKTFRGLKSAT